MDTFGKTCVYASIAYVASISTTMIGLKVNNVKLINVGMVLYFAATGIAIGGSVKGINEVFKEAVKK